MTNLPINLHLRSELGKALEHRSALTPTTTKKLIEAGYNVKIERSPQRIFDDEEFEKAGATLVEENTWRDAPTDTIIIGLKELPVETYLEFLQDDKGRRVAAFGYHAGFAGAALALENWAWQLTHSTSEPFPSVSSYPNENELIADVKKAIVQGSEKTGKAPRVLVIGALGRCGSGAVDLCLRAGVPNENVIKWDMAETAKGGPFPEIIESDIFVNCNLNNPIPIYTIATTFDKPTVPVEVKNDPPVTVISIDHLPSLLPREASESFSEALLPHLLELKHWKQNPVWSRAQKLFREKVATLPKSAL
ncbi:MAG: Saccharopine dehydrogenase [Claussenomyces sp. TS43310]|nr:MAG: Saccharopine dehydrogenase [Claussenomyces sp. TS43310]